MRVSVIGGGTVDDGTYGAAREVGRLLGERGHTVVCGGLRGVMEGVCQGVSEAGGRSIGIVPGEDRTAANRHVDVVISTGFGQARNVLVVLNGDAAIAINGAYGTLSEIGHALKAGRVVAGLDTHAIPGVQTVESPLAAVEYIEANVTTQ